jgi:hypothetical protein
MIKFNKCRLTDTLLDQWVSTEVNVLLVGEKGVGKSHLIMDTFKRNNLKYAYFSGSTLDPWIHLLGIPKAKMMPDGKEKMEFILPENLDDDVEAIFCDEWNRTNKVVRNALLELQQFKSINGRKFPKLKMVWGAVNPPKGEDEEGADYDVDELDPAQLDRFHVVVEMPNEPDPKYFKEKFGSYKGRILVDWWKEQSKDALKILSPRRLEYVGTLFNKGLDIKYLLPVSANVKDLVKKLSLDEKDDIVQQLLLNPTDDGMKEFVENKTNFLKYRNKLKSSKFWIYWKHVANEFLIDEIQTNENFANYAVYEVLNKNSIYTKAVTEIAQAHPDCDILKIIKIFHNENYKLEPIDDLSNYVSSQTPTFPLPKGGISVDNFCSSFTSICPALNWTTAIYNYNTIERKKRIALFVNCWKNISQPIHAINFMISTLISMQKATILTDKNFLPAFGATCMLIKKHLKEEEIEQVATVLESQKLKGKISSNRMDEFINFIRGKVKADDNILPEKFLKKIKSIRSVLNISGTGNDDILDLLKI